MSRHVQILGDFQNIKQFNYNNNEHRVHLMRILMKIADVSNECRPLSVSEIWLERLLTEFFNQVI
jgi:pyrroloquinoline quinone (PQQ) biosynthesis protein C